MPDEMVSKTFDIGELVWSSRYNAVAEIRGVHVRNIHMKDIHVDTREVYSIWVFGKHNEFAYQPWWELGKLDVLKQFALRDDEFQNTEKPNFNYRIE